MCFSGFSVAELDDIFGERAVLVNQDGRIVTSPTNRYSDWYYLESENIKLAFDVQIENYIVSNFRITPHAVENILRGDSN